MSQGVKIVVSNGMVFETPGWVKKAGILGVYK